MIIYDDKPVPGLRDFGIMIPLAPDRASRILANLRPDLPSGIFHAGFPDVIGPADLRRVHSPAMVDELFKDPAEAMIRTYELRDADGRPHRYEPDRAVRPPANLVQAAMRTCSGTLFTAQTALDKGFAYFLGGGGHHAGKESGAGFCMLNDTVIALRRLQHEGHVARAWIIDTDAHKGDGTIALTRGDASLATLSIHMAAGWPLVDEYTGGDPDHPSLIPADIDLPVARDGGATYLPKLRAGLEELNRRWPAPDLVMVIGGTDPWEGDELESSADLALTRRQMLDRDLLVRNFLQNAGLPQAWVMAGGYGEEAWQIHAAFLRRVLGSPDAVN